MNTVHRHNVATSRAVKVKHYREHRQTFLPVGEINPRACAPMKLIDYHIQDWVLNLINVATSRSATMRYDTIRYDARTANVLTLCRIEGLCIDRGVPARA